MQTPVSCFIVDDDEVDRLTVVAFARKHGFLQIDGVFENAEDAYTAATNKMPEVLFLDIDMPGISGLELLDKLQRIPVCIFITSYADYAVEGFEKEALDFLIKPIKVERFTNTMERLKAYLNVQKKAMLFDHSLGADTIFIKDGHKQIKIQLHEVIYLEALKDYTSIVTAQKKYCVLSSLGNLLKEQSFQSFLRIHRSYAVQKNYVKKISASEVIVNNIALPVGRSYKEALANL